MSERRSPNLLYPSYILCLVLFFYGFPRQLAAQSGTALRQKPLWEFEGDTELDTRLLKAVDKGELAEVRQLINEGANPKARQKGGGAWADISVLCLAVAHSNSLQPRWESIVTTLVNRGAVAKECSLRGVYDLFILRSCLSHGADANNQNPLEGALLGWPRDPKHWQEVIRLLLESGADPNWESPFKGARSLFFEASTYGFKSPSSPPGMPPLLHGTDSELYALIKLLIQHGAQINGTWVEWRDHACGNAVYGNLGRLTCWQWDGTSSSCYLPSIYCPSDRPIDHVDSGLTPLMHAAQFQTDLRKVKPLLSFGADPTLKDARGCTALDLGATPEIRKVLQDAVRSKIGNTAPLPASTCQLPPPAQFKTVPPPAIKPSTPSKIDFLCFKGPRAQRGRSETGATTVFGKRRVLTVNLEDPASLLSKNAVAEITHETLFSISLWRTMCSECEPANASVVKIKGTTYVNQSFLGIAKIINYDRLNAGGRSLGELPLGPDNPNPFALNWRLTVVGSLPQYVPVVETDPAIQRLCSTSREKIPLELLGLREAFPCGEPVAPPISLKIRVLNGATRCSPKFPVKEVVGCEISNTEIEFNGHEFSYVKHDTSEPVFGNGTITVDLGAALLHEMGHWAGINRHLTSPNNIMSTIVEYCKCVDEDVIKELANSTTSRPVIGIAALLSKGASEAASGSR